MVNNDTTPDRPAEARRADVVELVKRTGFARVADLSRELGVSEVTVRSDLTALEREGILGRVHGGAIYGHGPAGLETSFETAQQNAADEKRRIGAAAAALVTSGSSVLLDVGTTTTAVAEALLARDDLDDVVIITNGLSIALALESAIPRFTVVVTGGTLRPLQHSLVAPYASAMLEQIHTDLAIIGCTGVQVGAGVTNVNLPESELKRAMLRTADRSVVVADASKLGRAHVGVIGGLDEFESVITGTEADAAEVAALRAAGCDVRLV
ncbi:DeoR/GlpR family DNA-binding transcription regulator [Pseudoclavibacter helvolus]|uniref:DeoR family transcriptional regulator of aga operon n=1 Tax=Pseudoclavibacter helvolus TaxID=255205 RepID=A0A7W4UQK7_9MICO|nr:DeoR/GlpR family DNA-binding transcription regulator [Pseudoclavibacter helvolus]MBB2958379.1 DeoR family transcriptional regulator of aga operon [Pseudoclavibacter helvolus]